MAAVTHPIKVSIGADLGQKHDPTAIVVCEATTRPTGRMRRGARYSDGSFDEHPETENVFEARHLERLPLGTSYLDVAARIAEVARGVLARGGPVYATLIVDATNNGSTADDLRQRLRGVPVRMTAAVFTYGGKLNGRIGAREVTVGKAFLVNRLQVLIETGRLRLPPNHAEAGAMARELADYEIKVDERTAADTYGAFRVGTHDDLVTALGLAVLADPPGQLVRTV